MSVEKSIRIQDRVEAQLVECVEEEKKGKTPSKPSLSVTIEELTKTKESEKL